MAFVLVTRGHVRIDALYGDFSPFVRALLDLVALIGLAILVIALARPRLGAGLRQSLGLEPLQHAAARTPGLSAAAVVLRLRAVPPRHGASRSCARSMALVRGDYAKVAATIGVPSQDEEVKGELEGLGIKSEQAAERSLIHARHRPLPADRAARHQRSGRRRHGRAGPGAQPVLFVDAPLPGDGRHHLELQLRIHPDRHSDVRHAGRGAAARQALPCASTMPSPNGCPGCRAA